MSEQNREQRNPDVGNHMKKLICMKMDLRKRDDWGNCTWQGLSTLAHEAIGQAERFLADKNYRMFGLYFRLYADIWQYADEKLDPVDYQYFCCSQSSAAAAGVQ